MKREFSHEDVERILKNDAEIPGEIDKRIQDTYRRLGLMEPESSDRNKTVHKCTHRKWTVVAAAAAIIAGLSITAFAAARSLNVKVEKTDGQASQIVTVQPPAYEAHKIKISLGYVPEGYVYSESGPYGGKYRNETTDGGMTVVPFNAAEVYWYTATGNDMLSAIYNEEAFVGTIEDQNTVTNIFQDNSYYNDDAIVQNAYLFDEEEGYAVWVHLRGKDLPSDEVLKVIQNITVTVLDETVPYATEEEIAKELEFIEKYQKMQAEAVIDGSAMYQIGDTVSAPDFVVEKGAEYSIKDIQIMDRLPLEQYPKKNFVPDYDSAVAPLLNKDGTFKKHTRYPADKGRLLRKEDGETVDSKFVVVTAQITNTTDIAGEFYITPHLELLKEKQNSTYEKLEYLEGSNAYQALCSDGAPFYQSVQQFTENSKKHVRFAEIGAGETLECTFVYVVDGDCIDHAYMAFFDNYGQEVNYPRVKIQE